MADNKVTVHSDIGDIKSFVSMITARKSIIESAGTAPLRKSCAVNSVAKALHPEVQHLVIKNAADLGGGIRSYEDAKVAFDLGVTRVVIGSMAFEKPREFIKILDEFTPNKVVSAIDVINDEVVTRGRQTRTHLHAIQFAKFLKSCGVTRIVVTDVTTNGMLIGPNIDLSKRVAEAAEIKITHSGGVSGFSDLMRLQKEAFDYIDSVIIGRALYENKFSCQKIWRVAEAGIFN